MLDIRPVTPLPCLVPALCLGGSVLGGAAGALAKAAAGGVLDVFTSALSAGAAWMVGHVVGLVDSTTQVDLGAKWFVARETAMANLLELVVLPLLMAATIGAVLRQDFKRLARIWAVGLPVAMLAGVGGSQFAGVALAATDAMCDEVAGGSPSKLAGQFSGVAVHGLTAGVPQLVQMLVFLLLIAATLLVWLELLLRAAAVYIAMFFMPLALAGYVWPATATMAKRAVEVVVALILSKFVIVASLTLGLAALQQGSGVDDDIAGCAVLLLAGFAPFSLLRLAPIVETAAIAHLEGLSRRPFRAGARAATTAASAPAHPVARLLLSRVGSSGPPIGPTPVAAQPIPFRQADYVRPKPGDA